MFWRAFEENSRVLQMRAFFTSRKGFSMMMMFYVKYSFCLCSIQVREGGSSFMKKMAWWMGGKERGNMLKQLSLVNQKVNFFLHFLDYDFNLPSLQMRGEIKHCWASAKNFSACADKSKTLNYFINFKDFVSSFLISNVQLQGDAIKQQNGSRKCQIVKRRGHFSSSLTQKLTNKCLGALITSQRSSLERILCTIDEK